MAPKSSQDNDAFGSEDKKEKKEKKALNYYKDFSQTDLSWWKEDEKTHQSLWCLLSGTHWMCHTKAFVS